MVLMGEENYCLMAFWLMTFWQVYLAEPHNDMNTHDYRFDTAFFILLR